MQFHPKDLSELDELTEEHLGFSALSDGLGFTKTAKRAPQKPDADFDSDPKLQKKALSGAGAVAAGPVRPAPSFASKAARPVTAPSVQNVLSEPAAPQSERIVAFLLDASFVLTPLALAWWASFGKLSLDLLRADRATPAILFGAIFAGYILLSESFGGQSLGKMLMGLRVVEDDKYQKPTGLRHTAKRLALFLFGSAMMGLGLVASFRDPKRRPWHDRYSGSIVRKKA